MPELTHTLSIPQTPQELDRAIQDYRNSNLSGEELFQRWQAIRAAALSQAGAEPTADSVPGEDSY